MHPGRAPCAGVDIEKRQGIGRGVVGSGPSVSETRPSERGPGGAGPRSRSGVGVGPVSDCFGSVSDCFGLFRIVFYCFGFLVHWEDVALLWVSPHCRCWCIPPSDPFIILISKTDPSALARGGVEGVRRGHDPSALARGGVEGASDGGMASQWKPWGSRILPGTSREKSVLMGEPWRERIRIDKKQLKAAT